ncbi:hypothetical protein HYW53_01795 [Candidatus Giovannonibacteria bacterium]|nr:hypothetical protein [Candidatus Giovannonibacteria bacterium]
MTFVGLIGAVWVLQIPLGLFLVGVALVGRFERKHPTWEELCRAKAEENFARERKILKHVERCLTCSESEIGRHIKASRDFFQRWLAADGKLPPEEWR